MKLLYVAYNLSAENSKAWALCCLNVQILHIVPAFLQERYKEVDTEIKVLANVLFAKVDCADRSTHAQNLLELELNSGLNFFHLILNAFRLTDHDRELVDFVEHVTEQSRDLSHERLASDQLVEGAVLCGIRNKKLSTLAKFIFTQPIS